MWLERRVSRRSVFVD